MNNAATLPDDPSDALERYLDPTIFRALADPTRLALLARLATSPSPATVSELRSCCGVHLSGVSRHLKTLHDAGLIHSEKRGREVLYQLELEVLTSTLRGLAEALDHCRAGCCRRPEEKNDEHGSPT